MIFFFFFFFLGGLACICTIFCEYGFSIMLELRCILVCCYCMTSVGTDQLRVVTVLFLLKHCSYFTRCVSYRSKETEV